MSKKSKRDWRTSPAIRVANIIASVMLVLNLMPVQGLQYAYAQAVGEPSELEQGQTVEGEVQAPEDTTGEGGSTVEGGSTEETPAPEEMSGNDGIASTEDAQSSTTENNTQQGSVNEGNAGQEQQTATSNPEPGATEPAVAEPAPVPTSANLRDFAVAATVQDAATDEAGKTVVNEGQNYNVKLTFAERSDKQFANEGELAYELPAGFVPASEQAAAKEALVVYTHNQNGERVPVELAKESWRVDGNTIRLAWHVRNEAERTPEDVAQAYEYLCGLWDVEFDLVVAGTFAVGTAALDFGVMQGNPATPVSPIALSVVAKQAEVSQEEKKDEKKDAENKDKAAEENKTAEKDSASEETKDEEEAAETAAKLTVSLLGANQLVKAPESRMLGTLSLQSVAIQVQSPETNLNNMVKSVSISASQDANGAYTLTPGETYTISMSFAESGDKEFPNDATHMFYTLPNDFKLPTTGENDFKIIVTDPSGGQHTVSGNKYKINANNQLEVWFNKDDPNFHYLTDSTNARFSMSFDGEFDSTSKQIDLGNGVKIDVIADTTSSVSANKSASLDLANKKVYYTVAVTSTGHSTNVQIEDAISCKDQNNQNVDGLLTLDRGSFIRNTNKGEGAYQDKSITSGIGGSGNRFNYNIGNMKSGEVVTIKYSADIDTSKIPTSDGKTQVTIGNNKVKVKSDGQPTPTESEANTRIDYSPKLQKDGMTLNPDETSFTATYTFNDGQFVDASGYTLTDTVGDYLVLPNGENDGATVEITNEDGTTTQQFYKWGEGGLTRESDKVFKYKPQTSGKNKYKISYKVNITQDGLAKSTPTTVKNTVEYDNDHKSTGTGIITPKKENAFEVYKRVDDIHYKEGDTDSNTITWTGTINVPAAGLSNATALVDTLPSQWAPGVDTAVQDQLIVPNGSDLKSAFTITGLLPTESYVITQDTANNNFTIQFYKSSSQTDENKGLATSKSARIISITYKTTIDERWMNAAADNAWLEEHKNTFTIGGQTATASAKIGGVGVNKNAEVAGYRTINGIKLPVYRYTIQLKNVKTDDNTITDSFDRELLMPFVTNGKSYDQDRYGTIDFALEDWAWHTAAPYGWPHSTNPVTYVDTGSGMTISTNYDSMVKEDSGAYCPVTTIVYYLTIRDEAALRKMQNRAVNNADGGEDNKTYTITNTAEWEGSTDPGDVTYKFPGITKEMLTSKNDLSVEDGEIYADFKLTVNPGGAVINGGNSYDITDTIDHLSIDITSINVSPTPGAGEVEYDMSDNVLTFKNVPDGREYVITYRARIIYDSIGNTGDTVDINFKNDVKMLDYQDHISEWAHRKNTGVGAADLYAIKLMKYQAGNMSQKLNGAEFTLYESKAGDDSAINPDNPTGYVIDTSRPVKDDNGNVVTFTSGGTRKYGLENSSTPTQEDPGMVTVYGLKNKDGWALEPDKYYFLRETKAPTNHKLPGYDFQFMISEDGITHYEKYIYHSNDTMSAKNYPGKDIHIKKYWGNVVSGGNAENPADRTYQPADTDVVVVRLQQKIGDGSWSNTIRREVKDNPSNSSETAHWADVTDTTHPMGNQYSPLIELNKSNGWEADFSDLPLAVPTGADFKGEDAQVEYRVREWTINGKQADQTGDPTNGSNDEFEWRYQPQGNDMSITNVPKDGAIKLQKLVTINGEATQGTLADGWYNFTISGSDAATSSITEAVTVEVSNGKMTQALVDDETLTPGSDGFIEIGGLKIGEYTVTEEDPDNGLTLASATGGTTVSNNAVTVTVDGKTGASIVAAGKASFTNNVDLGGLRITKTVKENGAVPSVRGLSKLAGTYYFGVYADENCTTQAKTIDGATCTGSITVNANGNAASTLDFNNLKAGTYYVKETSSSNGMTLDTTVHPITVEKGKTAAQKIVGITNDYPTGALKIKKNVTINGTEASATAEFGTQDAADGTYTYQVRKGTNDTTTTPLVRVKITFAHGKATAAQYEWIDERTKDSQGKDVLHWHNDTDSATDIVLDKNTGTVTLKGLEPGDYVIHEIENQLPEGMALVGGNGNGGNDIACKVEANNTTSIPTAAFVNNKTVTGELEISKTAISSTPALTNAAQFTFTVTVYKDAARTQKDESINGSGYGDMTFNKGVATVTINGNGTRSAINLPTGLYYSVVESSTPGWQKTGETGNADSIKTTKSVAKYENKLIEGQLEVKKVVNSTFNTDKQKSFTFEVQLVGSTLSGTYGEKENGQFKSTAMTFNNGKATFTLKDGESKLAVGLPANTKYIVTETSEEGFVTQWAGNTGDSANSNTREGTIPANSKVTETDTNTRLYGSLEVDKSVLPTTAQGNGDTFEFTIILSDKTINGEFGDGSNGTQKITFKNGVATVTLAHGGKAKATNLPVGITYTITEKSAAGYALTGITGDNSSGKIKNGDTKVVFNNRHDDGGLVVSKSVTSPSSTDRDKYFPFKVELLDATGTIAVNPTGYAGTMRFTNGVAYVFLKHGEQAEVTGLDTGLRYTVTELNKAIAAQSSEIQSHLPSGVTMDQVASLAQYSTSIRDADSKVTTGTIYRNTISTATSFAQYTNSHITGKLTVNKQLVSDAAADKNQDFTFEVKVYKSDTVSDGNIDTSIDGKFGNVEFKQGKATIKLKGGASVTASGLPVGMKYTVSEVSLPADYTLEGTTTRQGSIPNTTAGASETFKNTRDTGELTVSKQMISAAAFDANKEFEFKIQLSDKTITNKRYKVKGSNPAEYVTFNNGLGTITVQGVNGEIKSKTIEGLPIGVSYEITETNTPGFMLTSVTTKNGDAAAVTVYTNDGTTATGTPVGSGTVANTASEATFKNERIPGEIVLSKEVISDNAADQDTEFELTLTLYKSYNASAKTGEVDTGISGNTYPVIGVTDSDASIVFNQGVATITLNKNNKWTASAKGLPTGLYYTVTETKVEGVVKNPAALEVNDWRLVGVTGTGSDLSTGSNVYGTWGSISTSRSSAKFSNQRQPGKLTISKKFFTQKNADADVSFKYTVTLYKDNGVTVDTGINKTYSGVKFTNGVSEAITLKGGQSKTIEGLPKGIYYKVTEDNDPSGFTLAGITAADDANVTTSTGDRQASGQLLSVDPKIEFKNTKDRGGLQFTKVVPAGSTASADQVFTFILQLSGATAVNGEGFTDTADGQNYTYGRYLENGATDTAISFKNGSATFKVKAGQTVTVNNLPLDVSYTITETAANGFVTTVDGTKADSANTAQTGQWYQTTDDKGKVTSTAYVGTVAKETGGGAFVGPTFTNTHEEGGLRVHKEVDSTYAPDNDANKKYHFRVELSDKAITNVGGAHQPQTGYGVAVSGDTFMAFKNGVAEFDLTKDQFASTKGLPAGITYAVTETSEEGIVTTWSDVVSTDSGANVNTKSVGTNGEGDIVASEIATTTAKNTRQYGRLAVTKSVVSHTQADKEYAYGFKVTFYTGDPSKSGQPAVATDISGDAYKFLIYDKDGKPVMESGVQKSATVNAGVASFTLKDGEIAAIAPDTAKNLAGLPLSIYYETLETDNHGLSTVTKLGQVTKSVDGKDVPYDNGKVRGTTTSMFTNMQVEGGLFVYKNVNSHNDADRSKEFSFRVALYTEDPATRDAQGNVTGLKGNLQSIMATSINGKYGTDDNALVFNGGVATVKLKDGEFRYAINLPSNTYFTVMEENDDDFTVTTAGTVIDGVSTVTPIAGAGYQITWPDGTKETVPPSTGGTGRIDANGNCVVTITNNRKMGNLKVVKSREGNTGSESDEFFFTVELSDKTINGTFGEGDAAMIFNNGVATFSLKKGQEKSTVEHEGEGNDRHEVGTLPVGVRYRVTERNAEGYLTSWESVTYANDTDGANDTPTAYKYQYNQTWTQDDDIKGLPTYRENSETRTITWDDHTSTANNPQFNYNYGDDIGDRTGGSANSWTLGDHSTEWGWRETDVTGKPTSDSTLQINAITDNNGVPNTDTVTFKNDRQKASIVLYKDVKSGLASDSNKTFRFHLQLLDSVPDDNYNAQFLKQNVTDNDQGGKTISYTQEKTTAVTFDDAGMGTVSGATAEGFDIKAEDLIIISGLPLGTRYVVTEDADSDFDSTDSSATGRAGYALAGETLLISDEVRAALENMPYGNLPDASARSGYTNTRKTGELEVRKTVQSDLQSDIEASYTFDITLDDTSYDKIFSEYRYVPWTDDWGQPIYVNNYEDRQWAVLGYDYNDSKTDEYGEVSYRPIFDTENGVLYGTSEFDLNAQVKFENGVLYRYDESRLGDKGIELKDGQYAHFYSVAPSDEFWQPQPGEIAYVPMDDDGFNGSADNALPRGVGYTVTEIDSKGLTSSWAGTTSEDGKSAVGTISTSVLAVADCTNTREDSSLTVSKAVISDAASDQERTFNFTVQLTEDDYQTPLKLSGRYGDMLFDENGAAEVILTGGDSATAEGLPVGTHYKITEASSDGFNLTSITTKVGDGGSTNADDDALQARAAQGAVATDNTKVEFTNSRALGFLGLFKTLTSSASSDQDKEFEFTVRLSDSSITHNYNPVKTGDSNHVGINFVNGVATVKLSKNQMASAVDLPAGLSYTVVEENAADYNNGPVLMSSSKQVASKEGKTADQMVSEFQTTGKETNVRRVGDLTVSKKLFNARVDDFDQEFDFRVVINGLNVEDESARKYSITYYDKDDEVLQEDTVTFDEDGVAYIKLKGDTKATISSLPTDVTYTVEEGDFVDGSFVAAHEDGYVKRGLFKLVGKVGDAGTINSDESVATFSNSFVTSGNLSVTKSLQTMQSSDENSVFRVSITLNDQELGTAENPKVYPTMTDTDQQLSFVEGVAIVDLSMDNYWSASAVGLPTGTKYTVEELGQVVNGQVRETAPIYKAPTYTYEVSETTDVEQKHSPITEDQTYVRENETAYVTVTNTREPAELSITKVWDDAVDDTDNRYGLRPESIEVYLLKNGERVDDVRIKASDDYAGAYEWLPQIILNEANNWTVEHIVVPAYDDEGNPVNVDDVYSWEEDAVENYTLTGTATNAGVSTLTNTIDLGNLKVTKHFENFDLAKLTEDDMKKVSFTVTDDTGKIVFTNTLDQFDRTDPANPVWMLNDIPLGAYTVTETNTHDKYSFTTTYKVGTNGTVSTEPAQPVVSKGNTALVDITNTYKPHKPGFDKKIKDTNDSTGETSDWQDSADYDIGDAVPYRLTATLANDVTAYRNYHITFTDQMEKSLTYNKDAKITVTGNDGKVIDATDYTVTKVAEKDHEFAYKITWAGADDGFIANEALNGATVEVLFTATLNTDAKLGKEGNVNACKLTYSNNPASADDSDEGELPWDYVIAFTYKVDVSKVDPAAKPLAGAEFKIEKLVKGANGAEDSYVEIKRVTNGGGENKNLFAATGLDDGVYRLTETKAPEGYDAIAPVTFTVTADHNVVWDYTSDAASDPAFSPDSRTAILGSLTGDEETGALKLEADEALAGLAGNVVNSKDTATLVVKKTVKSSRSEDKTREYAFKVTLDDKTVTGTYGDMEFKEGVATFKLSDGKSIKASGLPLNEKGELGYKVVETDSGGLTSSMGNAQVSKDGLTHTITCTNTYTAPKTSSSKTTTAKTGDSTSFAAVAVLAGSGALTILAGKLRRRRYEE